MASVRTADAACIFFGPTVWQQLQVPARLLTAEWSTGACRPPAYTTEVVQGFRDALPGVLVAVWPRAGVDHAASIMSPAGAQAPAAPIRDALTAGKPS